MADLEERLTPRPVRRGSLGKLAPVIVAIWVVAALILGGVAGSAATVYLMTARQTTTSVASVAATNATYASLVGSDPAETNISAIYKTVSPAVVSISAVTTSSGRFRGQAPQSEAGGTGFIVNDQGYILTNYHVVQGASKVTITLLDGTNIDATVAGTDPTSDLAVLKASIPGNKIAVVPLGDSDKVQPGELAIAIGSPFGLDHTLTSGIISAVNREFGTANNRPMRGLIQTDAPINPGNSGGPLFNANGEVIGITTSIESPVQGSVGIGFAIPINKAKGLLPQLQSGQKVDHTYLGITGSAVADLASTHKFPVDNGVLVVQVTPNSPAAQAGLKGGNPGSLNPNGLLPDNNASVSGDIITEVDGKSVKSVTDLSGYLDSRKVGDTVTLTVVRGSDTIKVNVTLGAWPASSRARNLSSGVL